MRGVLSVLSSVAVASLATVATAQSRPVVAVVASPQRPPAAALPPTASPQAVIAPAPGSPPVPVPIPALADWRLAPDQWTHAAGYRMLVLTISPAGAGCRGGATFGNLRYVVDKGFNPHVYGAATAADGGIVCSGGVWYHGAGPLKGKVGGTLPDLLIKGGKYFYRRT